MAKRKARSSRHLYAILLFVSAVGLYTFFFADNSDVQAVGLANSQCQTSWTLLYRQAQKNNPPPKGTDADWRREADDKNKSVPCQEEGGSGKCDKGETPPTPHATVCRADKDAAGKPASEEGLKKAIEAMKGGMPMGGGMPMPPMGGGGMPPGGGMPMGGGGMPPMGGGMPMPKTPPTDTQPKLGKCPDGSQKPFFGSCPKDEKTVTATRDMNSDGVIDTKDDAIATAQANEQAPASFADQIKNFFGFGGEEKPGADAATGGTHTFEGQLNAIANSNLSSDAKNAVKTLVEGGQAAGKSYTTNEFQAVMVTAEAEPSVVVESAVNKYPKIAGQNNLIAVGGSFLEGPAGFDGTSSAQSSWLDRIANFFSGLF